MHDFTAGGSSSETWLIYACRTAYVAEAAEIIWRSGGVIVAMVDNMPGGPVESDLAHVIAAADLTDMNRGLATVIPLITPGHRHAAVLEAMRAGIVNFPGLIDPTAVVARTASFGCGVLVNALAVVGARTTFGDFVHVV